MRQAKLDGFTLIELLITLAILTIVLGLVGFFGRYWRESLTKTFYGAQAIDDAYRLVNSLTNNLRQLEQGESGQYPIVAANDQDLAFFADIDDDGVVELVRYWLEGETMYALKTEPTGSPAEYNEDLNDKLISANLIANGVEPIFVYYNGDWPNDTENNPLEVNRALETRYMEVNLWVRGDEGGNKEVVKLQEGVHLRALKTNY